MTEQPPETDGADATPLDANWDNEHLYRTPYHAIQARRRGPTSWEITCYLARIEGRSAEHVRHIESLTATLRTIETPTIARCLSLDNSTLISQWNVTTPEPVAPLSAMPVPIRSDVIARLLRTLAPGWAILHEAGLGTFDLAPEAILCDATGHIATCVPSPWLPALAECFPARLQEMRFVAPELAFVARTPANPVLCDIYAMGLLAWYLLTGSDRPKSSQILPSQSRPEWAGWDALIAGCCRSDPQRRFATLPEAIDAIPTA